MYGIINIGVLQINHCLETSGFTVPFGSTQPLIKMSTCDNCRRPVCRVDDLATFMCRVTENPGSLKIPEPSWGLSRLLQGQFLLHLTALVLVSQH
jgi:hypothetical protein